MSTTYEGSAREAYNAALNQLRETHKAELNELVAIERQKRGLPRERLSQAKIVERLEKARARVAHYEAMLNGAS